MKRNIILALVSVVTALGFAGCTKVTSDGLTDITYYAVYSIYGDNPCEHPVGNEYVDAGFSAKIYDVDLGDFIDITDDIDVSVDVDGENMGIYYVTYSHTNVDGFTYAESRTVYVYNTEYDGYNPEGTYTVLSSGWRIYGGDPVYFNGGDEVTVAEFLPGFFYISDYIGGWYAAGNNSYGSSYAMTGYFTLDGNDMVYLSSYLSGWGDSLEDFSNGTYDPDAGTLSWDAEYTEYGMYFHVDLKLAEEE